MKRFTAGLLNRSKSHDGSNNVAVDSPEANAGRGVQQFCESGSINNSGEEVLHLPVIVEAAESSPQAAAAAAYHIRKFLSKDNGSRPYVQYNAIMLMRILTDNPGPSFTRNMDPKFVSTVKDLLRHGRDQSVQQILRETLDALEADKAYDDNLVPLMNMWRHEKGSGASLNAPPNFRVPPYNPNAPPVAPSQQEPNQRVFARSQLPPPHELSSRVEEARNTAKILLQLVQSTPQEEVVGSDLVKEFAERCQAAQRSMQGFINCDSPAPDDDTLQTLIEVNEQLSLALSRHQRAILSARRAMGSSVSPNPAADRASAQQPNSAFPPPPPERAFNAAASTGSISPIDGYHDDSFSAPPGPPPSMNARLQAQDRLEPQRDPFADPGDQPAYVHPMEPANYGPTMPPRNDPAQQQRPGPNGAYYTGATPSYIGRQSSAVNGLTMHGAMDDVEEERVADGHRGRSDQYDVSPVESRAPVTYRY
ncbi:hypothetical protein MBLNU459_g7549t1 [Dothideomycetes sp. NU459]